MPRGADGQTSVCSAGCTAAGRIAGTAVVRRSFFNCKVDPGVRRRLNFLLHFSTRSENNMRARNARGINALFVIASFRAERKTHAAERAELDSEAVPEIDGE